MIIPLRKPITITIIDSGEICIYLMPAQEEVILSGPSYAATTTVKKPNYYVSAKTAWRDGCYIELGNLKGTSNEGTGIKDASFKGSFLESICSLNNIIAGKEEMPKLAALMMATISLKYSIMRPENRASFEVVQQEWGTLLNDPTIGFFSGFFYHR